MAIMDIQAEEVPKGNNVTLESLAGQGDEEGQLENHKDLQEGGITANLEGNEITGEYKDYDYIIDGNLNVTIKDKKEGAKPVITYSLSTEQIGVTEVTITVKATISEGTIIGITQPNGEVMPNEGETNTQEITYKVQKSGKYTFKVESSTGRKTSTTVIISNILPSTPKISVEKERGYVLITSKGLKEQDKNIIIIEYDDNELLKNYYKEGDDGDWKEYTGQIATTATKISAKSVMKIDDDNNAESPVSSQVLSGPKATISKEAFDGNNETSFDYSSYSARGYFYVQIDNDAIGKKLDFNVLLDPLSAYAEGVLIDFVDENYATVKNITYINGGGGSFVEQNIEIPDKSKYIQFSCRFI